MSKKQDMLKKEVVEYDLTDDEKLRVGSLIALIEQARQAQDILYTDIVRNIGDRLEIVDRDMTLNFEEMMTEGVKNAKLIVS